MISPDSASPPRSRRPLRGLVGCALALALALPAWSGTFTLGTHVASGHAKGGYNNFNPGMYLRYQDWAAGFYRNSRDVTSAYLAYTPEVQLTPRFSAAIALGAALGYGPGLRPMALPSLAIALDRTSRIRLSAAPRVGEMKSAFIHLSYEISVP
jgi:hypothetical protein